MQFKLGILNEPESENRVAMVPETVQKLVKLKAEVIVEKGAGERAYYADEDYEHAGAKLVSRADIIKEAELIVSIHPLKIEEYKKIAPGKIVLAVMNPLQDKKFVQDIAGLGLTSFSLDIIPRSTRAQSMDILSSMATVAGYKAVLNAAHVLPGFFPMFMTAAGTIKPSKVLILGAGVAGLQAIATARKLGAVVEAFDVRAAVKEEVESLGGKFVEVEGARDEASAGGYAVEQTEEFRKKQMQAIHDHAVTADVVICTAQIPGKKAPLLIPKNTVESMKAGSVIIDLAASSGGNCELSENGKEVEHNHIKIIGESNYPALLPTDSSKMFGNNLLNFMKLLIDDEGNLHLNFEDDIVKGTCLAHDKQVVNERVKSALNL